MNGKTETYRVPPAKMQHAVRLIIDLVANDGHEDNIDEEDDGRYHRGQERNAQGGEGRRAGDGLRRLPAGDEERGDKGDEGQSTG